MSWLKLDSVPFLSSVTFTVSLAFLATLYGYKIEFVVVIILATPLLVSWWLSKRKIHRLQRKLERSESLLRTERRLLEVKVRERTHELELAQVRKSMEVYRFAEFGRMSSSFIHDLANPLTAVSLNFSALEADQKPELTLPVRDGITFMERYMNSARHQLRNQNDHTVFDVTKEIASVYHIMQNKARSRKVAIRKNLENELLIYGDPLKFAQIISNVISNAIDSYLTTKSHKPMVLINARIDTTKRQVLIGVVDSGQGISQEHLHRIFDPFYTIKSKKHGTGMGLTIVKRIVEDDFGGRIYVFSEPEQGTTIIISLPLHKNTKNT